jgi:hypothetical protein
MPASMAPDPNVFFEGVRVPITVLESIVQANKISTAYVEVKSNA